MSISLSIGRSGRKTFGAYAQRQSENHAPEIFWGDIFEA
jgi:hypothetical protein